MSAIPVFCCGPSASSLRSREPAGVTASDLRSAVDHRSVLNFAELKPDSRNFPNQIGRPSLPSANCEINRSQCTTGGSTGHEQCWQPFDPSAVSAGSGSFNFTSVPLACAGIRSNSLRSMWPLSPIDVSALLPSTPSQRTQATTSPLPVNSDPARTTAFQGFASQPQLQLSDSSMVPALPSTQVLNVSPGVHVQRPTLCAEHSWDWGSSDSAATTSGAVTLSDDVFIPAIEPSALFALSRPALCTHAPKSPTSTRIPTGSNWSPNVASASSVALSSSTAVHSVDQTLAVFASPLPFDLIPPDSLERIRPPLKVERSSTSVSALTHEQSTKPYAHMDLRSSHSSSLSEVQQQLNVGYTRKWSGIRELDDTELIRLSVKELNRFLQRLGVTRDAAQAFKHRRRTIKNRGYAYRCRQRRVSGQRELREQVLRLERELTVARTDRDALTAECALLRASCAAGCGLISLKEQWKDGNFFIQDEYKPALMARIGLGQNQPSSAALQANALLPSPNRMHGIQQWTASDVSSLSPPNRTPYSNSTSTVTDSLSSHNLVGGTGGGGGNRLLMAPSYLSLEQSLRHVDVFANYLLCNQHESIDLTCRSLVGDISIIRNQLDEFIRELCNVNSNSKSSRALQAAQSLSQTNPNDAAVSCSLARLMRSLWCNTYRVDTSAEFRQFVGINSKQFAGSAQQDAQEFLLWLLNRLHDELNAATPLALTPATQLMQPSGSSKPRSSSRPNTPPNKPPRSITPSQLERNPKHQRSSSSAANGNAALALVPIASNSTSLDSDHSTPVTSTTATDSDALTPVQSTSTSNACASNGSCSPASEDESRRQRWAHRWRNTSVISSLFEGFTTSTLQAADSERARPDRCEHVSETCEPFICLSVPIPEAAIPALPPSTPPQLLHVHICAHYRSSQRFLQTFILRLDTGQQFSCLMRQHLERETSIPAHRWQLVELEFTTAGWERGVESWQSVSEQDRLSPPSEPGPSTRFFAVELPAPPSESSSSSEEEENNAAPAGGVRGSPPAPASAPAVANGHAPPPHASAADGSLPTAPPPPPLHNQRQPTWENLSSGGPRIPGGMNSSSSTTVPTGAIASGVNGAPAAPEKPLHDQSILYIIVFHNFSFLSGSTISRRFNRLYAVCVFKESEYYTLVSDVLTEFARFTTAQSLQPSYAARVHQMDASVDSLPESQRSLVEKFTDMYKSDVHRLRGSLVRDLPLRLRLLPYSFASCASPYAETAAASEQFLSPEHDMPLLTSDVDLACHQSSECVVPHVKLAVEWDADYISKWETSGLGHLYEQSVLLEVPLSAPAPPLLPLHAPLSTAAGQLSVSQPVLEASLIDCLQLYFKEETLNEPDTWFCEKCGRRQSKTTKRLALHSLPDVLIIHLKRFHQDGDQRRKIDSLIHFPVEGLDLQPFIRQVPAPDGEAPLEEPVSVLQSTIAAATLAERVGGSRHAGDSSVFATIKRSLSRKKPQPPIPGPFLMPAASASSVAGRSGDSARRVDSTEELDEESALLKAAQNESDLRDYCTYDLVAVCNHYGTLQTGHYTAYCKNSCDGVWYTYDDQRVSVTSLWPTEKGTQSGRYEQHLCTEHAYILFYQRRSMSMSAWAKRARQETKMRFKRQLDWLSALSAFCTAPEQPIASAEYPLATPPAHAQSRVARLTAHFKSHLLNDLLTPALLNASQTKAALSHSLWAIDDEKQRSRAGEQHSPEGAQKPHWLLQTPSFSPQHTPRAAVFVSIPRQKPSWSKFMPPTISRPAHDAYLKQQHQLHVQTAYQPQTAYPYTTPALANEFHSVGSRVNAPGALAGAGSSALGYTRSQSTHGLPAAAAAANGQHGGLGLVPLTNESLLQPAPPPPSTANSAYRAPAPTSGSTSAYSGRVDTSSRFDDSEKTHATPTRARHLTEGYSRNNSGYTMSEALTTNYSSRITETTATGVTSNSASRALGEDSTSSFSSYSRGTSGAATGSSSSRYQTASDQSARKPTSTSQGREVAANEDPSLDAMVGQLDEFRSRQRTSGTYASTRTPSSSRSAAAPTRSSHSPPRARTQLPNTVSTAAPLSLHPSTYSNFGVKYGGDANRPLPSLPQSSSVVDDELSDSEPRVLNDHTGAFTRGQHRATSPAPGRRSSVSNVMANRELQLAPATEDYTSNGGAFSLVSDRSTSNYQQPDPQLVRYTYRNGIKILIDERGNEITKSFLSSRTNASAAHHGSSTVMPHYMHPTTASRGYPIASGSSSSQVTPRTTPLKSAYTGPGGAASTRNHGGRLQTDPLILPNRYIARVPEPMLTNFAVYRH